MDRKELTRQYKDRVQQGGVYAIKNARLDKWLVDCTEDMRAARNRFEFAPDTYLAIANDYKAQGGEGFTFEELEGLTRGETQSSQGFRDDLAVLKSLWLDKLTGQALY